MKKITLLACGGTIACVKTESGFVPGLSGEELLGMLPELGSMADIRVHQIMNIDSSDMIPSDWRTIARAVHKACDDSDGVVITHGTDTMCYTAAALSFMLGRLEIPVVLTGSQMPLMLEESDAPVNLRDAVRVAAAARAGVMLVFNHKIINGPRAFKMYSKNSDAYVSRNFPYLGRIDANAAIHFEHEARILRSDRALNTNLCEDVALLKLTPATNPSILDYIADAGYGGLVIEGFGTGGIANLNRGMEEGIRRLTTELKIPVLMISQCPYDGVNLAVYGIGEQASEAGVISGNDMTTETAVVKLMWTLGKTRKLDEIAAILSENYCDEISAGNGHDRD